MDEVTISKKEHEELLKDSYWLQCLEEAGVDNWEGIEFAIELFNEA